jgi:hypothetical protein
MSMYLALFVCIAGLLIFLLTGLPTTPPPGQMNMKWNRLGFAMFWVGLLGFLLTYPVKAISLFH